MKKSGILHPGICQLLASTGHTDYITICDRGFPVPTGPPRIDVALVDGIPTVLDVLRAVAAEWAIDRIIIAAEMIAASPQHVAAIRALVGAIPLEIVPHLELKQRAQSARGTIRTADTTPWGNIIVVSG
ncbi:MAG TPA: D-ribose pyranase [Chloroflexia bacterium]|nr:D-ribose pyranase [Chloroflexia bacterium]